MAAARNNTRQESVVITGDKARDMEGSESGAILDSAYHDQEGGAGEHRDYKRQILTCQILRNKLAIRSKARSCTKPKCTHVRMASGILLRILQRNRTDCDYHDVTAAAFKPLFYQSERVNRCF